MSVYPPDDFDELDEADLERAGAHRARPNPALAVLPLLLVALLVVAVVVGAITLARSGTGGTGAAADGTGPAATAAPTSSATGTGEPTASEPPTSEPAASQPTSTQPAPTEPATSEPPDRLAAVVVLNGTRTSGLAGEVAARLRDAGWDEVTTGNYREDGVPPSTVFYGPTEDLPAAEAAAADLGDLPVAQDPEIAGDAVTVLLGEDLDG